MIKEYTIYNTGEITGLYAAVGWSAYTDDPETLRKGFENSLLVLADYEDGKLAGLIRVVGDAYTVIFIQDIIVDPAYQCRGIGSKLLKQVLERYSGVRQIELVTDNTPGTTAFYRSLGFRDLSDIGCCGFMRINAP